MSDFLNRDLSWLQFNRRVLHEALDARTPLLERVRFLGIFNSNLDEFFMKRMGSLKRQSVAHVTPKGSHGWNIDDLMDAIRADIRGLLSLQGQFLAEELPVALAKDRLRLVEWDELDHAERNYAEKFFRGKIFPVLTPLSVDPGHPFPFLSNLSTSLGVLLLPEEESQQEAFEEPLFARVKVPDVFPTWIRVDRRDPDGEARFISVHELIARNLPALFPGMRILDVMAFRITRNAEIERDEEDAEDLLEMVAEELRVRRFADAVRIECGPKPNPRMLRLLENELELDSSDVYELPVRLDSFDLAGLLDLRRPDLKYPVWNPVVPPTFQEEERGIFAQIREQDLVVHHPFESFNGTVEKFLRAAATDPRVMAIKMTLYRTGVDSPFIPLLIRAAEEGKQVVCLVELKARFDEERNILVARELEKAGVHVVYGVVGLKTHSKVALVVRREIDGVRCYAHIGTGNYHSQTARLYTDLGLFTSNPEYTDDVVHLFHYLTGRSQYRQYKKLMVAPLCLKENLMAMIQRETEEAKAGKPARIIAKMNALEEEEMCRALYAASQAGVKIDLIVRGFCCLKPGVPGLSENIRVISVIGRFLEHSRIFYFRSGAEREIEGRFFISSADWMYRNLLARVEAVAPIEAPALRQRLWDLLGLLLKDERQAWELQPDGNYIQRQPSSDAAKKGVHQELMDHASLMRLV